MLACRMVMIGQRANTLAKRIEDLQNYMTGPPYLITYHRSILERVRVIAEKIRFSIFRCLFTTSWGPQSKLEPVHLCPIAEKLNLQGRRGQAKPYQVRQVRQVILKYGLEEES